MVYSYTSSVALSRELSHPVGKLAALGHVVALEKGSLGSWLPGKITEFIVSFRPSASPRAALSPLRLSLFRFPTVLRHCVGVRLWSSQKIDSNRIIVVIRTPRNPMTTRRECSLLESPNSKRYD